MVIKEVVMVSAYKESRKEINQIALDEEMNQADVIKKLLQHYKKVNPHR